MIIWRLKEVGFDPDKITTNGNKFLTGNGYMGIRGTLPEYDKEQFPAINLAGIYDRVGDAWREPVNAPNGLYTYIELEGKAYRLPSDTPVKHVVELDYRHGVFNSETTWNTPRGELTVTTERFASMAEKHLIVMKYSVRTDFDGAVNLVTGIDGDVWDINGPHYDEVIIHEDKDASAAIGITHESKDRICVSETIKIDTDAVVHSVSSGRKLLNSFSFYASTEKMYTLYKFISVFTSKDVLEDEVEVIARRLSLEESEKGYNTLLKEHCEEWEKKWAVSAVIIEGDDEAMEALNYSIYHLHCIAPRHSKSLSIAARGLSGQTYKGAVFWDTEMFMLDFFLFTEPEVAKSLLKYRIDTLDGARKKAETYSHQGAFYAWESQEGGYDACSDYNVTDVFTGRPVRTYFKDKQIHISAAVVYGIMRYVDFTGDDDLLSEGGAEVILECAKFYYSLLLKKVDGERYELHDVIGPDEYHERVNNNAYTNRMAKFAFECAIRIIELLKQKDTQLWNELAKKYDLQVLLEKYQEVCEHLYIPKPEPDTRIIDQFDGYGKLEDVGLEELKCRLLHEKEYWGGANGIAAHTKIIKQADVVTMLNLFSNEYDRDVLLRNWEYYEPRTEHGSSLSACMYAMLACKCGFTDRAYPFFVKSAKSDLNGKGKEWAGLIYIGGTHPASSGGAYMTAVEGFAGIHVENGELKASAALPASWDRLLCKVIFRGELYQIEVTKEQALIRKIS